MCSCIRFQAYSIVPKIVILGYIMYILHNGSASFQWKVPNYCTYMVLFSYCTYLCLVVGTAGVLFIGLLSDHT